MLKGPRLLLEIARIWDCECRLYMRIRQKSNRRIYCYFDKCYYYPFEIIYGEQQVALPSDWISYPRDSPNITQEIIDLVRTQNFPKNQHFLPPDTYTYVRCVYQGVRNVSFSENVAYVLNEWPPEVQQNRISNFAIDGFKIWLWENKPLLRYGGVYVSF